MSRTNVERAVLLSALTLESPFMGISDFFYWIEERKQSNPYAVQEIAFTDLKGWHFDSQTSDLVHESGRFFSIQGITVRTNWGNVREWDQPIINQPEIGLLGIITKIHSGILYFLLQAKIEPGNINGVQLAPSLQATKSNYSRVHKGKAPTYLEYFKSDLTRNTILDQLQSEQGARFLRKRNRNTILMPNEASDIPPNDDYCWLTLGQIKFLLEYDNIVNMDTRTVLSGITFRDKSIMKMKAGFSALGYALMESEVESEGALHNMEHLISWITRLKSFSELEVQTIPLKEVKNWVIGEHAVHHVDNKYFSVIATDIKIGNREVTSWSQPIIKSAQEGVIAFIIKKIDDRYHFLVQAKLEPGNFDIVELAPTIQCLTGNYRKGNNEYDVSFIEYVEDPDQNDAVVHYSTLQSEEGGRFYLEQNRNMIIEVGNSFEIDVPDHFIWMTLNQLKTFLRFNNYLNVQARSLLAAIRYI